MTIKHNKRICEGYEPIPGYVLETMIGRGGFGEVWRASAPGGMKKAVKFVFGAQDEEIAARERRSLERIKGVQHPFLLTLERFESIDDQLVIVTELADGTLEDEFKQHNLRGSCGIPRETLISYLHDASDALDYLHQSYQLQHLDIKPGNLLIVGGHVKVADFGLLKNLRETNCSIVGGLTPIYAPPEVFDGRPSMHSDQYSLAAMYQELLTGSRPFNGRTIAQLATQHVHSAPNLEPLPPSDRPIVARALEKNPERRFENCKAFVQALRRPRGQQTAVTSFGNDFSSEDTQPTPDGIQAGSPVEDLPQLSNNALPTTISAEKQVFVVALGGTGAECLRELRRRAIDYRAECRLDFYSALIDTDRETICSMRVGEVSAHVPTCNLIHTPLRSAHEYRIGGTDRLKTISRRWFYNVPRSGATEGMRPLGRLALVDHGQMVTEKLAEVIRLLAAAPADCSRSVYVVGSLAGGTGSGIYLDVVHLLRYLLDQAGMEQVDILSMLSSATVQADPANPLGLHDTQAALTEMSHFLQAGNGYPGDAGAQWPSVPAARTPLRHVYLVSGPTAGSRAPSPVDTISDYIWAAATGAGEILAEARKLQLSEGRSIIPPSVRSVGVVPLVNPRRIEQKALATTIVRDLLLRWLGLPSTARPAAVPLTDRVMRRIGLTPNGIMQATTEYLSNPQHWQPIEQAVAERLGEQPRDRAAVVEALASIVDSMIESGQMQTFVAGMISHLQREISVYLNDRRADVTTVIECLKLIMEKSASFVSQLRDIKRDPAAEAVPEALVATATRVIVARQLEDLCVGVKYLKEQLDLFATTLAMAIVQAAKPQANKAIAWDDLLDQLRSEFESVVLKLHESAVDRYLARSITHPAVEPEVGANTMASELMKTALPLIADAIEEKKLRESKEQASEPSNLADGWTVFSAQTDDPRAETSALHDTKPDAAASGSEKQLSIGEAVAAVGPALLEYGGLQRLILMVGSEEERAQIEPAVRDVREGSLTVAIVPGSTPKLIHEAQQIELTNILSRLTILNGGNAKVTARLSSRTDVTW